MTDDRHPAPGGALVAQVVSVDHRKLLPHYHLDTDLPEHLDYGCVADAARVAEAVARSLAEQRDPD